jgi:hypothetical protein
MTVFEYTSGLTSIVVGLAVARILGGVSTFGSASERSAHEWIVGSWCIVLLFALVGWWMAGWVILRGRTEVEFATVSLWVVATCFLYLAAAVLVPSTPSWEASDPRTKLRPLRAAFYFYLAAHFAAVALANIVSGEGPFFEVGWIPGLLYTGTLIGVSALGAVAHSDRNRTLHLVAWTLMMAVTVGAFVPVIGEAARP